ncbi:MAG TPA: hypothetical protein VJ803_06085 [Gemmatimonadaceae bacterium]|nr:hypothetical protein [Gemmatimonadaceae bacterium]
MLRRLCTGALTIAALLGCRMGGDLAGLDESAFIVAMAELRVIATTPDLDSIRRATARDSVLRARGVTAEQLERSARSLAADPEHAMEVWQEIDRRAEEMRSGASGGDTAKTAGQ